MMRTVWVALLMLMFPLGATAREGGGPHPLPRGAATIDVTDPPYNAKGDGKTDDTAAINRALADSKMRRWGHRVLLYFPPGEYLISDTIEIASIGKVLHGAGRDRTVLRLVDNAPGFGDPDKPKVMVRASTDRGGDDFWNSLYHMTIDAGRGNPGAIALKHHTSNEGAVYDVTIRSGDPDGAGAVGLDLSDRGTGPALYKHLRIEGFEVGIAAWHTPTYNAVFEHVELIGQRRVGIEIERLPVSIRGLISRNRVPALRVLDQAALVVLIDSRLTGGDGRATAIEAMNGAGLLVRNIASDGYGRTIRSTVGELTRYVDDRAIDAFVSHSALSVLPGAADRTLNLPIEETPTVPWGEVDKDWANVADFEPIRDEAGEAIDWSPAIRAAIATGKPTVWFPNGVYPVKQQVDVPGTVQRLFGGDALLIADLGPAGEPRWEGDLGGSSIFSVAAGTGPLVIERFGLLGREHAFVEHASGRDLVIRHIAGPIGQIYRNVVGGEAGRLFVEDAVKSGWVFFDQQVWMRHCNAEAPPGQVNMINNGGDVWILGYKHERFEPCLVTRAGGRTEVLGGLVYPYAGAAGRPAFICEDGQQSLSYAMQHSWIAPIHGYEQQVVEIREGRTFTLWRSDAYRRDADDVVKSGVNVPLYVGHRRPDAGPLPEPQPDEPTLAGPAPAPVLGPVASAPTHEHGTAAQTAAFEGPAIRLKPAVRWQVDWSDRRPGWNPAATPVVAGERVIFGDETGRVIAVDRTSGEQLWAFEAGEGRTGAAAVGQGVAVVGIGQAVYGLDVETGRPLWRRATEGHTTFPAAAIDGAAVFVSQARTLDAVDIRTGARRWQSELPRRPASGAAVADGVVVVGLEGGAAAVDLSTGRTLWFQRTGAAVRYPIATDRVAFLAADRIQAVDLRTGRPFWSVDVDKTNDPHLALAGGRLYVSGPHEVDRIHVLDAATGAQREPIRLRVPGENERQPQWLNVNIGPAIADGVLYTRRHADGWGLYAVDLGNHQLLWRVEAPRPVNPAGGSITVDRGVIYLQGPSGVTALAPPDEDLPQRRSPVP